MSKTAASAADTVLVALGLVAAPEAASGGSLAFLKIMLIVDALCILVRVPLVVQMVRHWVHGKTGDPVRSSFFLYLGDWLLLDLPRIFLHTLPLLFAAPKRIGHLLIAAGYYKLYLRFGKAFTLLALSWNRGRVLPGLRTPAFDSEQHGPWAFLLLMLPLVPTVLISTIPAYLSYFARTIEWICLILSILALAGGILAFLELRFKRKRPPTFNVALELKHTLFPLAIAFLTFIVFLVEDNEIVPKEEYWNSTYTLVTMKQAIQEMFVVVVYHIPFVLLLATDEQIRNVLIKQPLPEAKTQ